MPKVYEAGSDLTFTQYLEMVDNPRVRVAVRNARHYLKMNDDAHVVNAYNRLEKLVQEYLDGKVEIGKDDLMAWEMLGRPYETIAEWFREDMQEGHRKIHLRASERAMIFYAKALQGERTRQAYERSPIKAIFDQLRQGVKYDAVKKELP